jgi:capsular polysaccharide export protein
MASQRYLFLQGPISPFFARLADRLEALGHSTRRINLCFGDRLLWRRPGAINYRGSLDDWPAFIADYLEREGITEIVLLGEQRAYHRIAIEAAKARGIGVIATDYGYLRPDWITLERDGMSGASRFPRDPQAIRDLAAASPPISLERTFDDSFWAMVVRDMVYHLSASFLFWTHPGYRTHHMHHPLATYIGSGLRMLLGRLYRHRRAARRIDALRHGDRPYFLFPLQMATDFQIRAYSPYDGLQEPIETVLASFAANADPEAHLVVKIHPLDPGLVNWRKVVLRTAQACGIADRVHYVDGGQLDLLLDRAQGVVTINSTVGLTALRMHVPVKPLGTAVYDVPGLTHQAPLDGFWTAPQPVDRRLLSDYVRALAACVQLRGVFYSDPGLRNAVDEAVYRLHRGLLNQPVAPERIPTIERLEPAADAQTGPHHPVHAPGE